MQTLPSANRRTANGHRAILCVLPFVQLGVGRSAKHGTKVIILSATTNLLWQSQPSSKRAPTLPKIRLRKCWHFLRGKKRRLLWYHRWSALKGGWLHYRWQFFPSVVEHTWVWHRSRPIISALRKCIKKVNAMSLLPEPSRLTTNLMVWPECLALPLQPQELLTECV